MLTGRKPRRGKAIPVAPPRVPTPRPQPSPPPPTAPQHTDRRTPTVARVSSSGQRTGQAISYYELDATTMKVATPRMDKNGYFGYIAAATAKKKKISLIQSRTPPRMAFEGAWEDGEDGDRITCGVPDDRSRGGSAGSVVRNAAREGRVSLMSQRSAGVATRGPAELERYVQPVYKQRAPVYVVSRDYRDTAWSNEHHLQPGTPRIQPSQRVQAQHVQYLQDSNHSKHIINQQQIHNVQIMHNVQPVQIQQGVYNSQHVVYAQKNQQVHSVQKIQYISPRVQNQQQVHNVQQIQYAQYGHQVHHTQQSQTGQQVLRVPQMQPAKHVQNPQQAQAAAAAAFFARASQKTSAGGGGSPHRRKKTTDEEGGGAVPGGFCAALQRAQPPVPPALLRRLAAEEVTGVGKVKVMLRVSRGGASSTGGGPEATSQPSQGATQFTLDKRKRQATLHEPLAPSDDAPADRKLAVAAPKMFAFDAVFSHDDPQSEICSAALTDVIHAVINGTDGCLFCFGHAGLGKSYTMLGNPASVTTLGVVPCAISWLFRGISERRARAGTRFSVRLSAVDVCPHTNRLQDLLAEYATDSEQSPGVYLRDDPLFGTQLQNQSELRVHSAEKAAFYLDAAMTARARHGDARDSHALYTLHVYQYTGEGKGAVAGGRSRLHLIDLGNSERNKPSGGIALSGIGNILLAIFNGQRHLPYRDHNLTHVLRECLGSLTCHTAMIVHVSPKDQHYTETLSTLQLASRIHRLRRRKMKSTPTNNAGSGGSSGEEAPREADPSSSDLSADTVIYVGRGDDAAATDGEHPPVYIPNLNSGDNRCVMSKALRGTAYEHRHKSTLSKVVEERSPAHKPFAARNSPSKIQNIPSGAMISSKASPSHVANIKSSPLRRNSVKSITDETLSKSPSYVNAHVPGTSTSDEQWIDGPRISKSKVAGARHILKEVQHVKKCETWIDGPTTNASLPLQTTKSPLHVGALNVQANENIGYGYMDNHKKSMIRKWVENQTSQIQKTKHVSPSHRPQPTYKELTQFKTCDDECEDLKIEAPIRDLARKTHVEESVIRTGLKSNSKNTDITEEEEEIRIVTNVAALSTLQTSHFLSQQQLVKNEVDDDDDSEELAEIPPALPLMETLSSREVSMESLDCRLKERLRMNDDLLSNHSREIDANGISKGPSGEDDEILEIIEFEESLELVPTQDSCLQVTEEDIAFCMGYAENPLPEVDQTEEHPLRILSQENLTVVSTFTDSMSVYSDMERQIQNNAYLQRALNLYCDDFRDSNRCLRDVEVTEGEDSAKRKFEELATLHELYQSRLAMANVTPTCGHTAYREMSQPNLKLAALQLQSLSLSNMHEREDFRGNSSIYSEPPYKPQETYCEGCKQTLSRPGSANHWHDVNNYSSSAQNLENNSRKYSFSDRYRPQFFDVSMKDIRIASLRHPDGASNPNLKEEKRLPGNGRSGSDHEDNYEDSKNDLKSVELRPTLSQTKERDRPNPLPPLPITSEPSSARAIVGGGGGSTKPDGYDSGHESTARTSKHSPGALSRRAESGYDSVVRDSETSSVDSFSVRRARRSHANTHAHGGKRASTTAKYKHHDRSFCSWLRNPFACKYADTDPEISDF